jgi:hypothetical protein
MKDKLQFWSKSMDKKPGEGTGEYVEDSSKYKTLSKTKNWRKKLDNSYKIDIILYQQKWDSVDEFLKEFKKKHNPNSEMYKNASTLAMFAKFSQHSSMKKILLSTKDSKLFGNKGILLDNLMKIRSCIKLYDKKYNLNKISKFNDNIFKELLSINNINMFKEPKKEYDTFYAQDKVLVKTPKGLKEGVVFARVMFGLDWTKYDVILDENNKFITVDKTEIFRRK